MAEKKYTLSKDERVKKRRYIEQLFNGSKSFSVPPYRVFYFFRHDSDLDDGTPDWQERRNEPLLQAAFGATKKKFKRAVDRNRIKRLTREAYRLQKLPLQASIRERKEACLKIFLLYTGVEMPDFNLVKEKVGAILQKLENETAKF